jgi:hypothetical protein
MRARSVLIVLALPLFLAVAGRAQAQTPQAAYPQGTPTPEAAIGEAVQRSGGGSYAGDCSATTPDERGQVCSKHVADQGAIGAYLVGLAFSEYTQWVFVQQTPSGWVPLSGAAFDHSAMSVAVPWPAG